MRHAERPTEIEIALGAFAAGGDGYFQRRRDGAQLS